MINNKVCTQEIFNTAIKTRDLNTIKKLATTDECTNKLIERGLILATKLGYRNIIEFLINLRPIDNTIFNTMLSIARDDVDIEMIAFLNEERIKARDSYLS